MKTPVSLRFVRAWQTYSVGNVIQPSATLRQWLIASGFCVLVEPVPDIRCEDADTTAQSAEPVRAVRRGRPPKHIAIQG